MSHVSAIWAEEYHTRAIGLNGKLPWSKCELDLDILLEYMNQFQNLVVSKSTYLGLPNSFKSKFKLDVVDSKFTIQDYLRSKSEESVLVLGGKTLYDICINERLLNSFMVNKIIFKDNRNIDYDTIGSSISGYPLLKVSEVEDANCIVYTYFY